MESHSKRSDARAIHEALQGEDCFGCHVRGEKLRQKGGLPEKKHQTFLKQRIENSRCIQCRKMEEPGMSTEKKKHPFSLSGRTYCPKCQVVGDGDWKMCPKYGRTLLNLDKLIRKSALNPGQALFRKCHSMESALEKRHLKGSVDISPLKMIVSNVIKVIRSIQGIKLEPV